MAGSDKKKSKKKSRKTSEVTKAAAAKAGDNDNVNDNEVEKGEDRSRSLKPSTSAKRPERRLSRRLSSKAAIAQAASELSALQQQRGELGTGGRQRSFSSRGLTATGGSIRGINETETSSRQLNSGTKKGASARDNKKEKGDGDRPGSKTNLKDASGKDTTKDASGKKERKRSSKKAQSSTRELSAKPKPSRAPSSKSAITKKSSKSSAKKSSKSRRNISPIPDGDHSQSSSATSFSNKRKTVSVSKGRKEKQTIQLLREEEEEEEQEEEDQFREQQQAPRTPVPLPKSRATAPPPLSSSALANKVKRSRFPNGASPPNGRTALTRVQSMSSTNSVSSVSSQGSSSVSKYRQKLKKAASMTAASIGNTLKTNRNSNSNNNNNNNDSATQFTASDDVGSVGDVSKSRSKGLQKARSMFGSFRGGASGGFNSMDSSVEGQDNNNNNITNSAKQRRKSLLSWAKVKMASTTSLRGKKYGNIDLENDQEALMMSSDDGMSNPMNELIDLGDGKVQQQQQQQQEEEEEGPMTDISFENGWQKNDSPGTNDVRGNETKFTKDARRKRARNRQILSNGITDDENDERSLGEVFVEFNQQLNPNPRRSISGRNNSNSSRNMSYSGRNTSYSGRNNSNSGGNMSSSGRNTINSGRNASYSGRNNSNSGGNMSMSNSGRNTINSGRNTSNSGRNTSNSGRNNQNSNFSGMSGMNSSVTMNDSQCCPPISQIKGLDGDCGIGDDEELSDIGDTNDPPDYPNDPRNSIREFHEPEVIDGVTIIYNPDGDDIVHGDRGHPGTTYMIAILREVLEDHYQNGETDTVDFSPKVYKVVKKKLKGRKFLVRAEQDYNNRTSWREATKPENVKLLGDAFVEEQRRRTRGEMAGDGSDSDDDDDDISLEGSANNTLTILNDQIIDEEASPSLSSKKKVNAEAISKMLLASSPPPRAGSVAEQAKLTPQIANTETRKADRKSSTSAAGTAPADDSLLGVIMRDCRSALEIGAVQHCSPDAMQRGITAEEKLMSAIRMFDVDDEQRSALPADTEMMKEELDKVEELLKRIKYASIAPLLECLERIESNVAECMNHHHKNQKQKQEQEQQIERTKQTEEKTNAQVDIDLNGEEGNIHAMNLENGSKEEIGAEKTSYDRQDQTRHDNEDDEEYHEIGITTNEVDEEYYDESEGEESENDLVIELDAGDDELSSVGDSGIYSEETEEYTNDQTDELKRSDYSDFDFDSDDSPSKQKRLSELSIFERPNPKLQQFFDRLGHLFETRRRLQDRIDTIDPSSKCQRIKVKTHSGGIVTKQGKYNRQYQQRDQNDLLVRNLDDLYDAAQLAQTEFESLLRHLVTEVRGLHQIDSIILPKLKPRDRAFDKANKEYHNRSPGPPESWLYDILRAGIVCKSIKQLKEVNNWLSTNAHVVQAKNRFINPVFNGYRDLLYHVSIPYQGGLAHICEIQVHLEDIYVTNDQYGMIKHYEFFRSWFSNPWRSQEDTVSDLLMTNEHGAIAGPLMKHLMKSKDVEQLRLFAVLFRDKVDEFDRSLELFRRVLNLQKTEHGSEHLGMATTYMSIGLVQGALGDTDASLLNMLKALKIQESFLGRDHVEVADSYVEIGHMLSKRGEYSNAYTQYQRTLMIRENKLGNDHFLVIKSLQDIGLVLQKKGDFKESETEYRRALSIQKEVLGEGHLDVATTHSLIGKTLCLYGNFTSAMIENQLALTIRENRLGKNHPSSAESHSAIGEIYYHRGDYKSSRRHHTKALRIWQSVIGKECKECGIAHSALGELLSRCGDPEGAVSKLKRAHSILKADIGMDHSVTAGSCLDLGHIHSRHGQHIMALAEYRRAKVIRESIMGSNHPDTALTYTYIGNALSKTGDDKGAVSMHNKALGIFVSMLGEEHPITAIGYQCKGDTLVAMGKLEAALEVQRKALEVRQAILMNGHPEIINSLLRIGNILLLDDPSRNPFYDANGALGAFRHALTSIVSRCGEHHAEAVSVRFDVARALMALVDDDEVGDNHEKWLSMAEDELRAVLSVLRKSIESSSFKSKNSYGSSSKGDSQQFEQTLDKALLGKACIALGTVLSTRKNPDKQWEAQDLYKEGFERLLVVLGGDDPETKNAEQKFLSFGTDEM